MNTLKSSIHSLLVSDEDYRRSLGYPQAEPYQTFYINPPEKPTFPEVVWGPISDGDFSTEVADFLSEWLTVPFMVWAKSNIYETIAARIISLLHHQSNSAGFTAIVQRRSEELYDTDFDIVGVRILFNIHYGRPVI